ncbi:membrane-associated, eicosanoid/glutathione metabolism protein, partial [Cladorrhinum samala]
VTGSFLLPFTAYFSLLSTRVVLQRLATRTVLGTDSPAIPMTKPGAESSTNTQSSTSNEALLVASRAQANFAEYVPLALLVAAVAELNGAHKKALTLSLSGLLAARIAHVEMGLRRPGSTGIGRTIGSYGTLGVMGFLAGYAGYLVKGYWGY